MSLDIVVSDKTRRQGVLLLSVSEKSKHFVGTSLCFLIKTITIKK